MTSAIAVLLVAVAAVAAVTTMVLLLDITRALWLSPLRTVTLGPLLLGFAAATTLLFLYRERRSCRAAAAVLLCGFTLLGFAAIAKGEPRTALTADGALIELYTIHATRGAQQLGAYSRFGWHHPGPSLFYVLAPLYVLGGHGAWGLDAGALAINSLSVFLIAWLVRRKLHASPFLALILVAGLLLYVWRVPLLLTSAWNPHVAVIPLAALVIVYAAVADGAIRLLPVSIALASFVIQAHVALAPAALGMLAITVTMLIVQVMKGGHWREFSRWINVSAWVLFSFWLLPIAEQLMESPGNMTLLWRFFVVEPPGGQSFGVAWRAWSDTLGGVLRPDFYLAQGWALKPASNESAAILATGLVLFLPVIAIVEWRSRQRIAAELAGLCFVGSLVSLWSALRIDREIADQQIFWLSVIGVINLALVSSTVLSRLAAIRLGERTGTMLVSTAAAALAAGTVVIGVQTLVEMKRQSLNHPGVEQLAVKSLTEQTVIALGQQGIKKPLFQLDGEKWGIGAGVFVQFVKRERRVAVDKSLVTLFDRPWIEHGDEDAVLTICGPTLHRELVTRPDNFVAATFENVFVDGVRIARADSR